MASGSSGIPQNSVVLDWLVQSVHLFRMPAFFWISGYFFALTMSRGDGRVVLGRRLFRLLVPAIATWLTFNVAQEWVVAVANDKDPVEAILHGGVPIYHLWFLVDLVVMTLVAALAFALPEAVVERVRRRLPESGTVPGVLLALTALWFVSITMARLTGVAYVHLGGITTVSRLAYYLPFFGVGVAMYHLTGIRRTFLRVPPVLVLFAIPFGVYLQRFRHEHGLLAELAAPAEQLMVWICVAVVLQLFYRLIRRESRTVTTLSEASYSIYLFHHFIMVVLVLAVAAPATGRAAEVSRVVRHCVRPRGDAAPRVRPAHPRPATPLQREVDRAACARREHCDGAGRPQLGFPGHVPAMLGNGNQPEQRGRKHIPHPRRSGSNAIPSREVETRYLRAIQHEIEEQHEHAHECLGRPGEKPERRGERAHESRCDEQRERGARSAEGNPDRRRDAEQQGQQRRHRRA